MPHADPFLTTLSAAQFLTEEHGLPTAAATLRKLRCVGGGPTFCKFGRRVLYRPTDLLNWALRRIGRPLASTSAIPMNVGTCDETP